MDGAGERPAWTARESGTGERLGKALQDTMPAPALETEAEMARHWPGAGYRERLQMAFEPGEDDVHHLLALQQTEAVGLRPLENRQIFWVTGERGQGVGKAGVTQRLVVGPGTGVVSPHQIQHGVGRKGIEASADEQRLQVRLGPQTG